MNGTRSKFWNFIFSLIPGGGQMHFGLMKRGVLLLAAFVGVVMLAQLTYVDELMYIDVIIWFYSFFDAMNLRAMDAETLAAQTDGFAELRDAALGAVLTNPRGWGGVALILLGGFIVWNLVLSAFGLFLERYGNSLLVMVFDLLCALPKCAVGVLLILLGARMLRKKHREMTAELNEGGGENLIK